MIVASAFILLAEAAATCAPAGAPRLGGGAMLVRPVGNFEPLPFELLGPTDSVVASPEIRHTAVPSEEGKPQAIEPARRCEAPITIA